VYEKDARRCSLGLMRGGKAPSVYYRILLRGKRSLLGGRQAPEKARSRTEGPGGTHSAPGRRSEPRKGSSSRPRRENLPFEVGRGKDLFS